MNFRVRSPFRIYYCEPDWNWSPPPFIDFDIWCVLGGHGIMTLEDKSYPIARGSCLLFRPGDTPHASHDPEVPLVVFAGHFELMGEENEKRFPQRYAWAPGPAQADAEVLLASAKLILHFQNKISVNAEAVSVAIGQLLSVIGETASPLRHEMARSRLRPMIEALERKLGHAWSVEEMCRIAHMSRAQLTRTFHCAFAYSPAAYLFGLRVDRVRELLTESTMSLDQIAESMGFSDVHHFSRRFYQRTGEHPGAYRRSRLR